MTDINKEREAFQHWALKLHPSADRRSCWEGWLARAEADGWRTIAEAPEGVEVLVSWIDSDGSHMMFDAKEDGAWSEHCNAYDHFCAVAPGGSRGPTEGAPYTHWRLIAPPKEVPDGGS